MLELFKELKWNKKLQVLRILRGWSQNEAAEKCFTGQRTFWAWEKGQTYPRKNSRRSIAKAFKVNEYEIFGYEK